MNPIDKIELLYIAPLPEWCVEDVVDFRSFLHGSTGQKFIHHLIEQRELYKNQLVQFDMNLATDAAFIQAKFSQVNAMLALIIELTEEPTDA